MKLFTTTAALIFLLSATTSHAKGSLSKFKQNLLQGPMQCNSFEGNGIYGSVTAEDLTSTLRSLDVPEALFTQGLKIAVSSNSNYSNIALNASNWMISYIGEASQGALVEIQGANQVSGKLQIKFLTVSNTESAQSVFKIGDSPVFYDLQNGRIISVVSTSRGGNVGRVRFSGSDFNVIVCNF